MKLLILLLLSMNIYGLEESVLIDTSDNPSLIELFSTQSCSSCPPAQKWISKLKGKEGIYTKLLPIVYHVDYWDYLGWKDPYSNPIHTRLQKNYSRSWGIKSIYTPMFVRDGQEWRGRSNKNEFKKRQSGGKIRLVKRKKKLKVEFSLKEEKYKKVQVDVLYLGNGIKTKIKRGENRGLLYNQDFIVLHKETYLLERSEGRFIKNFSEWASGSELLSKRIAIVIRDTQTKYPILSSSAKI